MFAEHAGRLLRKASCATGGASPCRLLLTAWWKPRAREQATESAVDWLIDAKWRPRRKVAPRRKTLRQTELFTREHCAWVVTLFKIPDRKRRAHAVLRVAPTELCRAGNCTTHPRWRTPAQLVSADASIMIARGSDELKAGLADYVARLWRYGLVLSKNRDVAEDLVRKTVSARSKTRTDSARDRGSIDGCFRFCARPGGMRSAHTGIRKARWMLKAHPSSTKLLRVTLWLIQS